MMAILGPGKHPGNGAQVVQRVGAEPPGRAGADA